MTKIVDELLKTQDDLKHVTLDKEALGKRNFDLNLRLGELKRENATLSAMLAEKFEITQDAIRANSKLYQAGLRIRGMKATIKMLKEKLAHKLSDGEVIEIIRAYARKKEEVDVLKDILERIK